MDFSDLAARRADICPIAVPRNTATRRTKAKRALLAKIEKLGGA